MKCRMTNAGWMALLAYFLGGCMSSSGGGTQADPPVIATQPAAQSVNVGQTATFSVVASGTAPLAYQWQKNQANISGATSASYTTPATTQADNGATLRVIVSNTGGSATSNNATLTVNATATAPSITTQPANETVTVGQTASFSVVASGTAPLSYKWQKNQVDISGATSASYSTPVTIQTDNGATFRVIVTNSVGSTTSNNATLTVNATATAPSITTQPANQTVTVGQTATFSVVASGTAPLSYKWQKNDVDISGATSSNYTTPATALADNGTTFRAIVSNTAGSATSNNATLTVNAAAMAGTDVTTYKNDLARTGQNLTETMLTTANVNSTKFGLLRKLAVTGKVDAQPLYLSQLSVSGSLHNVVFVATEHDLVYAFDVGHRRDALERFRAAKGETPSDNRGCGQVSPEIGVTATPVIDRNAGAHGVIYVVAMSKDAQGKYHQRLHALDVTTGGELFGGPIEVQATFPKSGGTTTFAPGQYKERPGLLLLNGVVYLSFSSHCDAGPYTAWIIGYNQSTLAQTNVLNIAPNGGGPSIWMSGGAPAADGAGNIYVLAMRTGHLKPLWTPTAFQTWEITATRS